MEYYVLPLKSVSSFCPEQVITQDDSEIKVGYKGRDKTSIKPGLKEFRNTRLETLHVY